MLVHLDMTPQDLAAAPRDLVELRCSRLLRMHRDGHNLLVVARDAAAWLTQNASFIAADAAMLRRVQDDFTFSAQLLEAARMMVKVKAPCSGLFRLPGDQIALPLDWENFDSIIEPPVLIVEDAQHDGIPLETLIVAISKAILPIRKLPQSPVHGGGERIYHVAQSYIEANRVVWLVSDSDKRTPYSVSPAVAKLSGLKGREAPGFFSLVLPCMEIENLIGLAVLGQLERVYKHPTYKVLATIERMEIQDNRNVSESFSLFFDMKEGLSSSEVGDWSKEAVEWLGSRLAYAGIDPGDFDLPGFGARLMKQIVSSQLCLQTLRATVVGERWLENFTDFVDLSQWLFLAPGRVRV